MKENEQNKNLSLQKVRSYFVSESSFSDTRSDEIVSQVYHPHPLQALSDKVEACLNRQKEINFLTREVCSVIKKLK